MIPQMYQSTVDDEATSTEHADILAAIEARDADRAAALIDEHLLTVERQLTEHRRVPDDRLDRTLQAAHRTSP